MGKNKLEPATNVPRYEGGTNNLKIDIFRSTWLMPRVLSLRSYLKWRREYLGKPENENLAFHNLKGKFSI